MPCRRFTSARACPGTTLCASPASRLKTAYLAWIDCRALGLRGRELKRFIEDKAGLWLDYGTMFGPDGDGFIRINLATQKSYLERALVQLTDAVGNLAR
ncbi:MAG: hypothetical protein PUE62_02400 [Coriobacteriaceae bacterium]|nr:hypothetical protein [Coriobacteriaceae bacterium]